MSVRCDCRKTSAPCTSTICKLAAAAAAALATVNVCRSLSLSLVFLPPYKRTPFFSKLSPGCWRAVQTFGIGRDQSKRPDGEKSAGNLGSFLSRHPRGQKRVGALRAWRGFYGPGNASIAATHRLPPRGGVRVEIKVENKTPLAVVVVRTLALVGPGPRPNDGDDGGDG